MLIDLQLHSTYSDGYFTPTELAKFIGARGIKTASLTDHNTVGGLDEFSRACRQLKIKSIPGLELYVSFDKKKFNLLWYNYDAKDPGLHKMLRQSQIRRRARARFILEKLNNAGFKINADKILDKYNHYVPLNHLVDDVCAVDQNRKKINSDLGKHAREEEIISNYFYNKKIGIFHETYISLSHVLALRKKIGGQLILNHPGKYNHLQKNFLLKLKAAGIDGIEVLSPHHSLGAVMHAQYLADELGFIASGGSDFHRLEGRNALIQNSWNYFNIDSKNLKGINKIVG